MFSSQSLQEQTQPDQKTYNILLLGETGVGKSTFINAFVNYINFENLEDALKAENLIALIPTRFTLHDDDFKPKHIIFGSDENESWQTGASATQSARSYKFKIGNSVVRLIDTPGIGDTRGLKKDEENFELLLTVIGELKEIHAVCILLKPNEARVTVVFEYCIKQLFSHLQRSFSENIVFLFTNSRGTLYRPGDTIGPLRSILKEIATKSPKVTIPFSNRNVFCIDNEAFRFLIANNQGVPFTDGEKRDFSFSWKKSSDVCLSLIEYVTQMKPHKVQDIVSINEARRLISTLSQPLGEITESIAKNMRLIRQHLDELQDKNKTIADLKGQLYIPVAKIKMNPEPRTVCSHRSCTDTVKVGNSKSNRYRVCHSPCYLWKISKQLVGAKEIRRCEKFNDDGLCVECGHSYSSHVYLNHFSEIYVDKILDDVVSTNLEDAEGEKDQLRKTIKLAKDRRDRYVVEMNVIQNSMAKFSHFLKHNAITGYHDDYKEYIELLIEREKAFGEDADTKLVKILNKLLRTYEKEKKDLDDVLERERNADAQIISAVTAAEIIDEVQKLYTLELSGPNIKDFYDKQRSIRERQILTSTEKEYVPASDVSTKFIRYFQNQ